MSNARPTAGRIVWHDLMTTDPKASLAFFTELVGWRTKEADMGPLGNYTMFSAGDQDIGGVMPLEKSHGVPSHFIAYISVDDIDATLAKAEKLGGKVAVPATDIPGVGKFAVLMDPLGGITSPMKVAEMPPEMTSAPPLGAFCWEELMSTDPEASEKFYSEVYGWTVDAKEMSPGFMYRLLNRGDDQTGGIMKTPSDAPQMTSWVTYIHVGDVDATLARAEKLGGKICAPAMDIPNVGRVGFLQDPSGAMFAVFKGAERLEEKAKG